MTISSKNNQLHTATFLKKHFPEIEWTEEEIEFRATFLTPEWLTTGVFTGAIDKSNVEERLDRIEKLIRNLDSEYRKLPLQVRKHLEVGARGSLQQQIQYIHYDLTGEIPSFGSEVMRNVYSELMPRKKGAIAQMRDRVEGLFSMHHTQRDNEFMQKVQLVDCGRRLWKELKEQEPPLVPSDGTAFHALIADLIVMAGKDWDAITCCKKHRDFSKGN